MSVLIKPIVTEKATAQGERFNCYTFVVANKANKIQIKTAVEETYEVSVEKVRTMNYPTKRLNRHTKRGVQKASIGGYKKAIVQIAEGDQIDVYSSI